MRSRGVGLRPHGSGTWTEAERNPGSIGGARESPAGLFAGAAPVAGKAGRRTTETCRPSQSGTRTSLGLAQLQQRDAQATRSLSDLTRRKRAKTGERKVKVEVLYVAECPSHPAAVRMVKDVLAAESVAAEVQEI